MLVLLTLVIYLFINKYRLVCVERLLLVANLLLSAASESDSENP